MAYVINNNGVRRFFGIILVCVCVFFIGGVGYCGITGSEDDPDHDVPRQYEMIEFGSSPNPVGSGARAMGMGGAFISIADDATAASWNPAGLIQLELPEVSIVGAYTSRNDQYYYESHPDAPSDQSISATALNYLSAALPFKIFNRNMVVSLNYQHMYEFDKKVYLNYQEIYSGNNPDDSGSYQYIETNIRQYDQDGSLYTISPAFAVQIIPTLSMGMTLNFWENFLVDNQWQTINIIKTNATGDLNYLTYNRYNDSYSFSGINFHVGFLWNPNSFLTIGGVFKSPFKADIEHIYERYDEEQDLDAYKWDETLDMPMSYGLAMAIRANDVLTFAIDAYTTHWEDYLLNTPSGKKVNPITSLSEDDSDIEATTQIRLGMEYLKMFEKTIIPFRCGLFYDPEPANGHSDEFWGVSLGTGFLYKKIVFDIAWQYRFGDDVRGVAFPNENTTQDVKEHKIYTSLIYHF
ncbi:conserved hypothetical protein [Desulfamplus magnetovallimortis]|uniref:Membrane protein involved in aromatic hydrocarbon degradation n=1 Tax=Desulfamplus magnetovallimortis TaxID=1246637 RepID=A0A1W1HA86_9BACT|nr:outer membrane protein transport protein [Desulfamplus magnetovallimortis]SLM29356.1 conserved hypothetical protein [Desulfamplus magnetovallimortis]